ncbi:DNA/RNA helicase domain-containing protein [Streptomyces lydicus]|uniref:DNA/RNA helicase domain-containing protein n=1 Tax=Streptomyces lydicus TaxID=47763 RepID=UPI00379C6ECB
MLLRKTAAALSPLAVRPAVGHSALTNLLIERHRDKHRERKNPDPDPGLVASWDNSLPYVVEALIAEGLGQVELLIEFPMPGMDETADAIVAGRHPLTEEPSYVVIELKQWRRAVVSPDNPVAVDAGYRSLKLHPVRQVQRYCEYLIQHLAPLREHADRVAGAALLHNARSEVEELFALERNGLGHLFTTDSMDFFRAFLSHRLAPVPGSWPADLLCQADEYQPISSRDAFSRVGSPHPVFALQKEQELVFQETFEIIKKASTAGRKKVIIIQGGPGSGKTALAVELLRVLKQAGKQVVHASGSHAFTQNLRDTAVKMRPRRVRYAAALDQAQQDYRFFNQFGALEENAVQVLIADEAHRLRNRSRGRPNVVPPWVYRRGWPQADELIKAAQVPIFLLDDWQSLGPDEVGSTDYLRQRAEECGCEPVIRKLPGMFRAGGSARFRDRVTELLGLQTVTPRPWEADGKMEVRLADSPQAMETYLEKRVKEEFESDARVTAGFCWEWEKPQDGMRLEVQIDAWHRPWNARNPRRGSGLPNTTQWATDPRGFGQVGCIYTAQNFEFDWSGVIIGPDLVWHEGKFITDRTKSHDDGVCGKSVSEEQADRLIRNAYYVLLTRARRGVVIYAYDTTTQNKLRELITGTAELPGDRTRRKRRQPPRSSPSSTATAEQLAIEFD